MKTYQVTLPDEIAEIADRLLAEGGYESFDDIIIDALESLREQVSRFNGRDKEWLRKEVQKGIDSADRGETLDGEEVMARLLAKLDAARNQPT